MKINFLGIGVQKAGTSTLHDILKQHSEIFLPQSKEAHFFDLSDRYQRGFSWLEQTFFSDYNEEKIVGKFTPEYIYFEEAPLRILRTLGTDVKFILVFRNPVDRAVSHYNMTFRRGIERQNFWEAIKDEHTKIRESELAKVHYSYITRGYYASQLKRFLKIFPEKNFLFLCFENDIVKNIEKTIERIEEFLGVEQEILDCSIKSNEAYSPRFVKLNQFIRNQKKITHGTDLFSPLKGLKKIIKLQIAKLNKPSSNVQRYQFELTTNEKVSLFTKHFLEETEQLEKLTGLDLKNIWQYE